MTLHPFDLTPEGFRPSPFALHRWSPTEPGTTEIAAWGMTLPDGSAIFASAASPMALGVCSNAERAAWMHGAALSWLNPERDEPD